MSTVRYLMNTAIYLPLLCVIILNSKVTAGSGHSRLPEVHVALFVFGDSLYDPGNNNYIDTTTNYQANFLPYGETYFRYPTGRFSDGRLIPDFISEYAKLPLVLPYLKPGVRNYEYGVNFASGGAGALVQSHQGFVVDLKTQLGYFKKVEKQLRRKLGAKKSKALISSAVYMISVGGNDYLSPFTFNSTFYNKFTKEDYISMVLGNFTEVVEGIYRIGARKFGFVTMPPLGCLPGTKILNTKNPNACFEEVNILTKKHNSKLPKVLELIQNRLKEFNYSIHDLYTSITERLENPSRYGFKEVNMGCCGSGVNRGVYSCGGKRGIEEFELCEDVRDYFFFDPVHPSEKAYKQLSKLLWSGNSNDGTKPYNLQHFFEHL